MFPKKADFRTKEAGALTMYSCEMPLAAKIKNTMRNGGTFGAIAMIPVEQFAVRVSASMTALLSHLVYYMEVNRAAR